MDIATTWNKIRSLPADEYARLRLEAENRLLMRGVDEHTWAIVRLEMVDIFKENT